jgi:hypothetical protein
MISLMEFRRIIGALGPQGREDFNWAESVTRPEDADAFATEAIFVICNSGMKNTIARVIFERCHAALLDGAPVLSVFGHKGKAAAIETIWRDRRDLFERFAASPAPLDFLESLPWIGSITKFHLARNFGVDCVKPDVHLARLARVHETTPHELCAVLAKQTGYRIGTVDVLLWRACANGVIDYPASGKVIAADLLFPGV